MRTLFYWADKGSLFLPSSPCLHPGRQYISLFPIPSYTSASETTVMGGKGALAGPK